MHGPSGTVRANIGCGVNGQPQPFCPYPNSVGPIPEDGPAFYIVKTIGSVKMKQRIWVATDGVAPGAPVGNATVPCGEPAALAILAGTDSIYKIGWKSVAIVEMLKILGGVFADAPARAAEPDDFAPFVAENAADVLVAQALVFVHLHHTPCARRPDAGAFILGAYPDFTVPLIAPETLDFIGWQAIVQVEEIALFSVEDEDAAVEDTSQDAPVLRLRKSQDFRLSALDGFPFRVFKLEKTFVATDPDLVFAVAKCGG